MDTFTFVLLSVGGLLCVASFCLFLRMFFRQRKLDKQWSQIQKELRHHEFDGVRAIVMQHSDPEWQKEWLQKIDAAERSN